MRPGSGLLEIRPHLFGTQYKAWVGGAGWRGRGGDPRLGGSEVIVKAAALAVCGIACIHAHRVLCYMLYV